MASPLVPDPYATLSVPKDATLATIRGVYRKLVLTCHPDKVIDEAVKAQKADQFHQVQQAYEILSDDSKRAEYDRRVKLAELRAEVMSQSGGRSRVMRDFAPRPSPTSTYETRGNAVYEERAPRRSYEDDFVSPKYEEHRSAGKKFDDRYDERSSRRSSGRGIDEKRRARDIEDERWAKEYAKAAERSSHAERRKTRDRGRRQEYDVKYRHVKVESDSESDSEVTERFADSRRVPEPQRKHDDDRRRAHGERPRRNKEEDSDFTDEHETKTHYRIISAADHIEKSSGIRPVKLDEVRRPSIAKLASKSIHIPPPPPPPAPPPVDTPRRSSARSRGRRESSPPRMSGRGYREPEFVEPLSRREYDTASGRRPSLPTVTSEPANIKISPTFCGPSIPRAVTMETRSQEPKQSAGIRRSQTTPLASMLPHHRGDMAASKTSKYRNEGIHDSGYSSPGTPEMPASHSPIFSSKKFFEVVNEDEEDGMPLSPQVREVSPRSRHRSDRPPSIRTSSNARPPPPRSATYAPEPQSSRPGAFSRTQSSTHSSRPPVSPTPRLFGEVHTQSYKVPFQSPKYDSSDVRYSSAQYTPRRRSGDSSKDHRDAYAYSESKSARSSHPGMPRGGSYVQQESVH